MCKIRPWFKLPENDETTLAALVDQHGVARVLAVLSRIQVPKDRNARAEKDLRELCL
jgi:hypothetical protein